MRQFYRLISFDPDGKFASVIDYQPADIDPVHLWMGTQSIEPLPDTARLLIDKGLIGDYVANPLSWPIGSLRLTEVLRRLAPGDFQSFRAPLFKVGTLALVGGYEIINVCHRVACLNVEESKLTYSIDQPDSILVVYEFGILGSKVDAGIHIFRVDEWPFAVIISEELAKALSGKGFLGIALEPCTTS